MPDTFRAYVVEQVEGGQKGGFRDLTDADLPKEPVLIDVAYSSLNFKDGLAVTGAGKVIRKFPMVPGIDLAGTVLESTDAAFRPGDQVVTTCWGGMSESTWGGYTQRQRVNPAHMIHLPKGITPQQAMAIGTAGYTAMLSVLALEGAGMKPEQGEVLVTGAAGGVGSVSVAILSKLGYRVVAATGRPQTHEYLKSLGASAFIARADLDRIPKPLEKARWAGAVDSVGSKTLATVLAQLHEEAAVAACGLVGGTDLPATVHPIILRGVKLLGINALTVSNATRDKAWARLATDLDLKKLDAMTFVEPMSKLEELAAQILRGETLGRVVIDTKR
jgi:putative YhdH/YhfP family quinone oxidoreductase